MATNVNGPLRLVTDQPASLVQVMVRAPKPRPHAGGMVVDFTTPATVVDGTVSFPCVPGPAVLSVMHAGVPQVTVPLVVPDKDSATLEECIRAAELADTATRSELEDLARRIVEGVSQAEQAASAAAESADAAEADRLEVASDREAVEGYRTEVTTRYSETLAARSDAMLAAETATGHATTATEQAGAAAESAAAARESETSAAASAQTATQQADRATSEADRSKTEADRAASEAEASSVKAVTERVNELTRGAPGAFDTLAEIAEELERGQSAEAALVKEISGKAPADHTHNVGDVTGLQSALDEKVNRVEVYNNQRAISDDRSGGQILRLHPDGRVWIGTSSITNAHHATNKSYVDQEVAKKANTEMVTQRPALFSGAGAPPASIPGAVVGDWWFDTSSKNLYKITGV